ncbi:MAG: glycosyltransferase [Balneolaceae bacterium]
MIPERVKLSILLTSHLPEDTLLKLIADLGSLQTRSVEVIIIDDGMPPAAKKSVSDAVLETGNDAFFLYEREVPYGRGNCLNEALSQANGTYIWVPTKAQHFREMLLEDTLKRAEGEMESFWSLDVRLPMTHEEWMEKIQGGLMPPDECFLWNRERIDARDLYFNPFLEQHFGAELALRLYPGHQSRMIDPFFVVSRDVDHPLRTRDAQEFLFSALRPTTGDGDPKKRAHILERLFSLETDDKRISADQNQLKEAAEWIRKGDHSEALKLVSSYLQRNPGDKEATKMKIFLLERLRRHVEASELKYKLKERSLFDTDLVEGQNEQRATPGTGAVSGMSEEYGGEGSSWTEGVSGAEGGSGVGGSSEVEGEYGWEGSSGTEGESGLGGSSGAEGSSGEERVSGAKDAAGGSGVVQEKGGETTGTGVEKAAPTPRLSEEEIECSVIIPTTGHGKALLENALIYLSAAADPKTTELLVIDNASLDDTVNYLEQLKQDNFLNIRVFSQVSNRGFGTSVNIGLDAAHGNYRMILHTDTEVEPDTINHLKDLLDSDSEVVMSVPMIEDSRNEEQLPERASGEKRIPLTMADSACFMLRKDANIRFDESFFPVYFEMEDLCRQIVADGGRICASGLTTVQLVDPAVSDLMGLRLVPQLKWANRAAYMHKWGDVPKYSLPNQGLPAERFERLGSPINPEKPEKEWLEAIEAYLTSEVKTEILRGNYETEDWITIISALVMADQRELMRTLEDRLDSAELPVSLLVLMIHYYFKKNIYSRCRYYLEKAGKKHDLFDLFRLRIAIADKDLEAAASLLNSLLKRYPSSPDLLFLASELYRQSGEEKEAELFLKMAHQMDPKRFSADLKHFQIF